MNTKIKMRKGLDKNWSQFSSVLHNININIESCGEQTNPSLYSVAEGPSLHLT